MSLFFQQHFQDGGTTPGGGCPPITLGDFVGEQPYIDGSVDANGAYITGGEGPYTMTLVSGSLPGGVTGLMSVETEPGVWVWLFEGTFYTDLEISTLTIGGTDANGCVITPKEYTVTVKARIINDTPVASFDVMALDLSGLPATIGTGIEIESIKFSSTLADNSLVGAFLDDTGFPGNQILLFNEGDLSGAGFVDTEFKRGSVTNIISSSPPYTGSFAPTNTAPSGFDIFNGSATNGTWTFYLPSSASPAGTIDYVEIILRPI